MTERFTFKKEERLSGKIWISKLFSEGKTIFIHPFKIIHLFTDFESEFPAKMMVSVPKKNFKRAVDRNLLKRRIREVYRLYKPEFYGRLNEKNKKVLLAIIFTGSEIAGYTFMEEKLRESLRQLSGKK